MPFSSVIIHLSDLEFGEGNRAHSETDTHAYQTCADWLVSDVNAVVSRYGVGALPKALVLSGDVAGRGHEDEYRLAAGFVRSTMGALGIPADLVAVVPGNHDVTRPATEAAFLTRVGVGAAADEARRREARLYPEKLAAFAEFASTVAGVGFAGPESVVAFPGFVRLGVALVGLDTTYPCTFLDADNYGLVRDVSTRAARRELESLLGSDPALVPVALLHHSPNPLADLQLGDSSYLRNAAEALRWLAEAGFSAVLAGHEHRQRSVADLRLRHQVFVSGSFGLALKGLMNRNPVPDRVETNRYQLFLVDPAGPSELVLRKLEYGGKPESRWVDDDDDGPCRVPIRFVRPRLEPELGSGLAGGLVAATGHPIRCPGSRFVISVSLTADERALSTVQSASYAIGGSTRRSESRRDNFGAMVEFGPGDGASVQVRVTHHGGKITELVCPIPPIPA